MGTKNSIIHSLFLLILLITSAISLAILSPQPKGTILVKEDPDSPKEWDDIERYIYAQGPTIITYNDKFGEWNPKSLRPMSGPRIDSGVVEKKPVCKWYFLGCTTWKEGLEVASNGLGVASPLITVGTWLVWWRKKKS
jgi:hypothetical protein